MLGCRAFICFPLAFSLKVTLAFLFTGSKEDQFLLILHLSLALLFNCKKETKQNKTNNQTKKTTAFFWTLILPCAKSREGGILCKMGWSRAARSHSVILYNRKERTEHATIWLALYCTVQGIAINSPSQVLSWQKAQGTQAKLVETLANCVLQNLTFSWNNRSRAAVFLVSKWQIRRTEFSQSCGITSESPLGTSLWHGSEAQDSIPSDQRPQAKAPENHQACF